MATPNGYSRLQIALHWAIALLIGFQLVAHDAMNAAYKAVVRGLPVEGYGHVPHVIAGILVLVLVVVRLAVRQKSGVPTSPDSGNALLKRAATATHWGLYFLLFAIPLSGLAAWFLLVRTAGEAHEVMFNLLLLLVLLHSAAALFHQYVLKDRLLSRMLRAGD